MSKLIFMNFKKGYKIFIIIVLSAGVLLITASAPDEFAQLQNRLLIGGFFLVLGFIFMRYQKTLGRVFYNRQIAIIKKHSSVESFTEQGQYFGSALFSIGVIVLIFGFITYFI